MLLPFNVYSQEDNNDFTDSVEQVLEVGNLQLDALYIYKDVVSPKDGYLLNLEDVAQIKIIMDDFQSDCDRWIDQVKQTCIDDLKNCQDNAKKRISTCHSERDTLRLSVIDLKKEIKEKEKKIIFWTIGGSTAGILLGVITTLILK